MSVSDMAASHVNSLAMSESSDSYNNKRKKHTRGLAVTSKKVALTPSRTNSRPTPASRTHTSGTEFWESDSTSSLSDCESLPKPEESTPPARTSRMSEPKVEATTPPQVLVRDHLEPRREDVMRTPMSANSLRFQTEHYRVKVENQRLKTDNDRLKTDNDRLKTDNTSLNDKVASLTAEVAALQTSELAKDYQTLRDRMTEVELHNRDLSIRNNNLDAQLKTTTTDKDRVTQTAAENIRLKEQNIALVKEKEAVVKENVSLRAQNKKLEDEVRGEIKDFEEYKKRVRALGNEFRRSKA